MVGIHTAKLYVEFVLQQSRDMAGWTPDIPNRCLPFVFAPHPSGLEKYPHCIPTTCRYAEGSGASADKSESCHGNPQCWAPCKNENLIPPRKLISMIIPRE